LHPYIDMTPLTSNCIIRHHSLHACVRTCPQWVCAAAKAGEEEGVYQIGGSCIIAPTGEIVAQATTDGDEVIVADMDLDLCNLTQTTLYYLQINKN
jgi:predicted amidohydrolase